MRWFACPEITDQRFGLVPRVDSEAEALDAISAIDGPWALRLAIGLPTTLGLLDGSELAAHGFPAARRFNTADLVSVWCSKNHDDRSYIQCEPAHEVSAPASGLLIARTTAPPSSLAYREQIHAAVRDALELPAGPIRLELSFTVGRGQNWLDFWKPTIESLDPLLGRSDPDRAWHPRDGRITELGMHITVDPTAHDGAVVGVAAAPAPPEAGHARHILRTTAHAHGWEIFIDDGPDESDTYLLPGTDKSIEVSWAASGGVLMAWGHDKEAVGCTFISRGDFPAMKTERVVTALVSRTVTFPPDPPLPGQSPSDPSPRRIKSADSG
jgi:hypothetical protein